MSSHRHSASPAAISSASATPFPREEARIIVVVVVVVRDLGGGRRLRPVRAISPPWLLLPPPHTRSFLNACATIRIAEAKLACREKSMRTHDGRDAATYVHACVRALSCGHWRSKATLTPPPSRTAHTGGPASARASSDRLCVSHAITRRHHKNK